MNKINLLIDATLVYLTNEMTHPEEPLSSSSSTYGAVLINPSSLDSSRPFNTSIGNASNASLASPPPAAHRSPHLTYPLPLVCAAIFDAAYGAYHVWLCRQANDADPSALSLGLTAVRVLTLAVICGCSKRWRSLGGWVAAASGISVGASIWRDCVDQLTGMKKGRKAEETVYLYTVSAGDHLTLNVKNMGVRVHHS